MISIRDLREGTGRQTVTARGGRGNCLYIFLPHFSRQPACPEQTASKTPQSLFYSTAQMPSPSWLFTNLISLLRDFYTSVSDAKKKKKNLEANALLTTIAQCDTDECNRLLDAGIEYLQIITQCKRLPKEGENLCNWRPFSLHQKCLWLQAIIKCLSKKL